MRRKILKVKNIQYNIPHKFDGDHNTENTVIVYSDTTIDITELLTDAVSTYVIADYVKKKLEAQQGLAQAGIRVSSFVLANLHKLGKFDHRELTCNWVYRDEA